MIGTNVPVLPIVSLICIQINFIVNTWTLSHSSLKVGITYFLEASRFPQNTLGF